MDKAPEGGKREQNHKGKLFYESKQFSGVFDVSFHEAPVEPLLELEGRVVKLGPNGHEIETRRPYVNLEDGVEIKGEEIKKVLRYEDGSEDPFFNLPKTKVFRIVENRPISECTLDAKDPTVSYGTVIPQEEVEKYAVAKVGDEWEDKPAGYHGLAKYLEERGLALLYPYSFGNGRAVYTVLVYPVRIEGKLYVVKKYCTGQIVYRHPLEVAEVAQAATTLVEMPPIRIRNRKAAGVQ